MYNLLETILIILAEYRFDLIKILSNEARTTNESKRETERFTKGSEEGLFRMDLVGFEPTTSAYASILVPSSVIGKKKHVQIPPSLYFNRFQFLDEALH